MKFEPNLYFAIKTIFVSCHVIIQLSAIFSTKNLSITSKNAKVYLYYPFYLLYQERFVLGSLLSHKTHPDFPDDNLLKMLVLRMRGLPARSVDKCSHISDLINSTGGHGWSQSVQRGRSLPSLGLS